MDYRELNEVRIIKKQFDRECRRLEDLRALAQPSTPPLDGMPHGSSPPLSSKVETVAMLIVESEQTVVRLSEDMESAKYRVLVALQSVPMKELSQRVLSYHYVGCKSFEEIAKILHYSKWHIIRLHDEGIQSLNLDVHTMIQFKKTL